MAENPLEESKNVVLFCSQKSCSNMVWIFQRPKVKKCIVQAVIANIIKVIELTRRVLIEDDLYNPSFTNVVFQWSMQHFAERMNPNIDYIDVLRLENPKSVLITKFLTDLYNLEKYVNLIADNATKETIEDLEGCLTLLEIRSELLRDFRLNRALVRGLEYEDKYFAKSEEKELRDADNLKNKTMDAYVDGSLVIDPVSQRHYRNTVLNNFNICDHKFQRKIFNSTESLRSYALEIEKCNYAFNQTVIRYNEQIEEFKNNITYWSWKYDHELEKVDNEGAYYALSIDAMKKQKQEHEETIVFYRQEIQRIFDEEALERQKQADALAKAELAQLEKQSKTSKSKKGKPKNTK